MSALNNLVLATLPSIPRPIMRRLASRYIAGETLDEALAKLKGIAARGHPGILDILGEGITSEAAARDVMREYKDAATRLARAGLDAYVSVKPTHLALTLRVFESLRRRFDNVGIVLQSRLLRTPQDIDALAPGPLDVRMVKGIYLEPASIAHTEPEPIRAAYVECTRKLLQRGAKLALATHDEELGERCLKLVREFHRTKESYEFQVLLGVREELWERWRRAGHRVRVYVPYGPEWRAYSQRRLRKNPQILRHVMRDALGLDRR